MKLASSLILIFFLKFSILSLTYASTDETTTSFYRVLPDGKIEELKTSDIRANIEVNNQVAPIENVTIAILAKDKAHTLPYYLTSIEEQTWPTKKTHLYIRTNNNNDNTAEILHNWVASVCDRYASIYFDDHDVEEQIQQYKQHEWNPLRFKVLGKIRQDSISWAKAHDSHYFVVDCDNFIYPETLQEMVNTNLPIVAPFLTTTDTSYSNYHALINKNGYFKNSNSYYTILNCVIKGLIDVPVVHCTYFIRNEVLDKIVYNDSSCRHEYVIFSENARLHNIPQYLDNRKIYGHITFKVNEEDLQKEPWLHEFKK